MKIQGRSINGKSRVQRQTNRLLSYFHSGTVNNNMPRVSYMKAIDCHLFVSFGFVFATMLEYIIVLNVSARERRKLELLENYEVGQCTVICITVNNRF